MKNRKKQQQDTEGQRPSINVPAAADALIKRIVLKEIIAKHQWNNVIKYSPKKQDSICLN